MENGDDTFESPTATEETVPNGAVPEAFTVAAAVAHPAKSYAAVAAENTAPNGGVQEDVAAVDAPPAKSYAAVAANAEIEDLRATKSKLEEALANATKENHTLAAETHRLEGLYAQAREDVATAEHAAAATEGEASLLREKVDELQALLNQQKVEREADKGHREEVVAEVEATRQAKLKLEKEIETLKASTVEESDTASASKEEEIAWQGMAASAAAGAAITAAVVLLYLRLKR